MGHSMGSQWGSHGGAMGQSLCSDGALHGDGVATTGLFVGWCGAVIGHRGDSAGSRGAAPRMAWPVVIRTTPGRGWTAPSSHAPCAVRGGRNGPLRRAAGGAGNEPVHRRGTPARRGRPMMSAGGEGRGTNHYPPCGGAISPPRWRRAMGSVGPQRVSVAGAGSLRSTSAPPPSRPSLGAGAAWGSLRGRGEGDRGGYQREFGVSLGLVLG